MENLKCKSCHRKGHVEGECEPITDDYKQCVLDDGAVCHRETHYHEKVKPVKQDPKDLNPAEKRIAKKLKKELIKLCRVEGCKDKNHFHPVKTNFDQELPVYEDHTHDQLLFGKRVPHFHPCEDCGEMYKHTHKIRSARISESEYDQRCDLCHEFFLAANPDERERERRRDAGNPIVELTVKLPRQEVRAIPPPIALIPAPVVVAVVPPVVKDAVAIKPAKVSVTVVTPAVVVAAVEPVVAVVVEALETAEVKATKEVAVEESVIKEVIPCESTSDSDVEITTNSGITFECEHIPTEPAIYRTAYIMMNFLFLILVGWFTFDLFLWPLMTIKLYEALSATNLSTLIVGTITFCVFQFENFITVYILVLWCRFKNHVMWNFICRHRYTIGEEVSLNRKTGDFRPHNMSFGKTKDDMEPRRVSELEVYTFEWKLFGLKWEYYGVIVGNCVISYNAFAHIAATLSGRLSYVECESTINKSLEKCGYINWNKNFMVKNNVVKETSRIVLAYRKALDTSSDTHTFSRFNYVLNGPSTWRPKWWGKNWYSKIVVVLFFMTCFFFFTQLAQYFIGLVGWCVAALAKSPSIPPAFHSQTVMLPKGVYGFNVDDIITHKFADNGTLTFMKTNEVGDNKGLKFKFNPKVVPEPRRVMGAFSPYAIPGIAMPFCNLNDSLSFAMGIVHRGAGKTPKPDPAMNALKKDINNEVCNATFLPITTDEVLTPEEALSNSHYTQKRQEEILAFGDTAQCFDQSAGKRKTAAFGKSEPSPEPKHTRTIQGMHEDTWSGGIFQSLGVYIKTVESLVYGFPTSVKHMKPVEQIKKLLNLGPGTKTVSDYSSYEASFSREVQETAQFPLYDYMFQLLPEKEDLGKYYRWMLGGTNIITNKLVNAEISNLKCSGDFDTSLSNWWDNTISWLTMFQWKHDVHWTDCIDWILCEGDDNITDDHGYEFENEDFEGIGMTAKIESELTLEEAGFCQKFVNSLTGNLLGDPIRYLGKANYIPIQYINAKSSKKKAMSRAKAMSTLSMYPNAPVISEHAWAIMCKTKGIYVTQKQLDASAKYGQRVSALEKFKEPEISEQDRVAVSEIFDFDFRQQQDFTDRLFKWSKESIDSFELPVNWFPAKWQEFYDTYNTVTTEPLLMSEEEWSDAHNHFVGVVEEYT